MSLTYQQAAYIAATLKGEFNNVATFETVSSLNTSPKVLVFADAKAPEATLQAIEARASTLAGRTMTSNELEFKSGRRDF